MIRILAAVGFLLLSIPAHAAQRPNDCPTDQVEMDIAEDGAPIWNSVKIDWATFDSYLAEKKRTRGQDLVFIERSHRPMARIRAEVAQYGFKFRNECELIISDDLSFGLKRGETP